MYLIEIKHFLYCYSKHLFQTGKRLNPKLQSPIQPQSRICNFKKLLLTGCFHRRTHLFFDFGSQSLIALEQILHSIAPLTDLAVSIGVP